MRIISQDGKVDIPYDYFLLSMDSGKFSDGEIALIYCRNLSSPDGTKLARYSTKEKAIKAMEMLRKAWINEAIEFTHGIYHRNIIFQFPQDDEIEV